MTGHPDRSNGHHDHSPAPTYAPGPGTVLAGPGAIALVTDAPTAAPVEALLPPLVGGLGFEAAVEALLALGLPALGDLGCAFAENGAFRVLLRGRVTAEVEGMDGSSRQLTSGNAATWQEIVVDAAIAVTLHHPDASREIVLTFPLVSGSGPGAAVRLVLADEPPLAPSRGEPPPGPGATAGGPGPTEPTPGPAPVGAPVPDRSPVGESRLDPRAVAQPWPGPEQPEPEAEPEFAPEPASEADGLRDEDTEWPGPTFRPESEIGAEPEPEVEAEGFLDGLVVWPPPPPAPGSALENEWDALLGATINRPLPTLPPETPLRPDSPETRAFDPDRADPGAPQPTPSPPTPDAAEPELSPPTAGAIDGLISSVPGWAPAASESVGWSRSAPSTAEHPSHPRPSGDARDEVRTTVADTGLSMPPGDSHTIMRSTLHGGLATASQAPITGPGTVQAVHCPAGHPNPAHAGPCRICGEPIVDRTIAIISRPALGSFFFEDGTVLTVDGPLLLGRKPPEGALVLDQPARAIRLEDPDKVLSRTHLEVRLADWQVQLVDRDSMNHTYVELPGRAPFRLHPGEPYPIPPGTKVNLGDSITFTFQAAGVSE